MTVEALNKASRTVIGHLTCISLAAIICGLALPAQAQDDAMEEIVVQDIAAALSALLRSSAMKTVWSIRSSQRTSQTFRT